MSKTFLRTISSLFVGVTLLLFLQIGINIFKLVGTQTPGFGAFNNGRVFALVDPSWSGYKGGLKILDEIQSYDNIPFTTFKDLRLYASLKDKDQSILYKIKRAGEEIELPIKTMFFSVDHYFLYYLVMLVAGMLIIFYGYFALLLRPNTEMAFLTFLILSPNGFFVALTTDLLTYQHYGFLFNLAVAFFVTINSHVAFVVYEWSTSHQKITGKKRKILFTVLYSLTGIVALLLNWSIPAYSGQYYVVFHRIAHILYLAGTLFIYFGSVYFYKTAQLRQTKNRILIYLLFHVASFGATLYFILNYLFFIIAPFELTYCLLFFPFFGVFITLYTNFMDVAILPKRGALYIGLGVFLSFFLLADFSLLPSILRKYELEHLINLFIFISIFLKFIFFLGVSYCRVVERFFFPSTFKFHRMIRRAGDRVLAQNNKDKIIDAVKELIRDNMGVEEVHFFETELPPKDAHIVLPVVHQHQELGCFVLGPKPKNLPYSKEDRSNLQSLISLCAVALVNTLSYETIVRLKEKLKIENALLRKEVRGGEANKIIGENKGLKEVFEIVNSVAASSMTVLLQGESGTGKEVIATALHDRSERVNGPLVKINCAAIPDTLLESELFGHEKGSFTGADRRKIGLFEVADKGTIFLDEIGELPLSLQPKLLRALESREIRRVGGQENIFVDVRVIAATNINLQKAVEKKKFRADLFYRLNVMPLTIPPLRERQDDLVDLVRYFLKRFSGQLNRPVPTVDLKTWEVLKKYSWPGNVRELQNVIERAVVLTKEENILVISHLDEDLSSSSKEIESLFDQGSFIERMAKLKSMVIKRAILKANGNKSEAARNLDVHVVSLFKMMRQLGLKS